MEQNNQKALKRKDQRSYDEKPHRQYKHALGVQRQKQERDITRAIKSKRYDILLDEDF